MEARRGLLPKAPAALRNMQAPLEQLRDRREPDEVEIGQISYTI
jgi:hypothetical protein